MATGTVNHEPITSGTPTIISGSGATLAGESWAFISWVKWGQFVLVSVCGLRFSAKFTDARNVLQLPYKSAAHTLCSQSKDVSYIMEINENSDKLMFSNVGTVGANLFGQFVYITSE